jgi:hypothetical protein
LLPNTTIQHRNFTFMKALLFDNWNFMRVLRLAAGIAIIIQGIAAKEALFVIMGVVLAAMAIFNAGCCGSGGCATKPAKKQGSLNETTYEEVV